jgi:(E)-4-hydroxy-3-methyl-but-2-enyl pyrophosphate reductase
MPVQVATHAGFCMGVSRAVSQALNAAQQANKRGIKAFSLGELIHNPAVVQSLADQGLIPVQWPEEAKSGILVLRSHGASPDVIAECKVYAEKIVDCTCPFVHHVHQLVHDFSKNGAPVVVLGDPEHPEVKGIWGWCQGAHYVLQAASQIDDLPDTAAEALVVSQTTLPPSAWNDMTDVLKERFPKLTFRNTICQATSIRQAEAEALAKTADRMIVIGGKESANTRKLAETCLRWCPETYLIQSADELASYPLDPVREMIGITAGASTPAWLLKEVVDRMNDMEQKGQTQNPETLIQTLKEQAQEQALPAKAADTAVEKGVKIAVEAPVEATIETPAAPAAPVAEASLEAEKPVSVESPVKAVVAPKVEKTTSFMDEVAASIARIRNGQTITGKIVQMTDDLVFVNIAYKSDGLLKREELVDKDAKVGDEIDVEIVKVNDGEGNVILSQRNIVNRKVWNVLLDKYHQGLLVEGVGKEAVKGGLLATIDGVRAFIPASHLAQRYVEKISQFVGQPMKLKIIEVDESKKRVVASRKEALALENDAVKENVWGKLVEGAVVTGIIRRFTNFGAFVDLGGVDGLIHVSDLSWNRSVQPSDVLQPNQEVEVKILSLDRERERIALGYKQLQPRPWDNVEEKYPVGTVLTRKIVRVRPFGAFIELEPGVDGLVHISQVAPSRVEKIEDVIAPGQEVHVKVLAVDPVAKRISLSIREAMEDSALSYDASIPGEGADSHARGYEEAAEATEAQSTVQPEAEKPETSLELAMRKAQGEFDAQESKAAEAEEETEA